MQCFEKKRKKRTKKKDLCKVREGRSSWLICIHLTMVMSTWMMSRCATRLLFHQGPTLDRFVVDWLPPKRQRLYTRDSSSFSSSSSPRFGARTTKYGSHPTLFTCWVANKNRSEILFLYLSFCLLIKLDIQQLYN